MAETNGAVAPNDGGTPDELPTEAIDGALQEAEAVVVDTRAIKAEQEAAELRQQVRAQMDMISDLRKTTVSQSEMLSELVGRSREAEDRGFEWAREDILKRMHDATRNADEQAFLAARRDLDDYEQHARKRKAPKKDDPPPGNHTTQQQTTVYDPVAAAWVSENPWFNTDPELFDYALNKERRLGAANPNMSTAERLAKVKEDVVKRFPEKFPNQARQQPPTVSRPGPQAAAAKPKPKTKTVADLPEDAKTALRIIKRRDPSFTDEDYIKSYKWDT